MNIHFTKLLAKKLSGTGVTATCLHPGTVNTSILRGAPNIFKWSMPVVGKTAARGAKTSIYLAASPEVEGKTGLYYNDKQKETQTKADSNDMAVSEKLWALSAEMCGISL